VPFVAQGIDYPDRVEVEAAMLRAMGGDREVAVRLFPMLPGSYVSRVNFEAQFVPEEAIDAWVELRYQLPALGGGEALGLHGPPCTCGWFSKANGGTFQCLNPNCPIGEFDVHTGAPGNSSEIRPEPDPE
jgi:hypothetical protein